MTSERQIRAVPLPKVSGLAFEEALAALLRAIPELATSADEIRRVYERAGFALVRSADLAITERVHQLLAARIAAGEGKPSANEIIQAMQADFTPAYAETVVRNATNRAYAAGRMRQAAGLEDVAGLVFRAVMDGDTRHNHAAADGVIARVDDPIWDRLSPPLGH